MQVKMHFDAVCLRTSLLYQILIRQAHNQKVENFLQFCHQLVQKIGNSARFEIVSSSLVYKVVSSS